jgi:uncharacterized protein
MTPRSDHEEDMSMEEILASIRKFVTDNPPEDPRKQRVYKGDISESVVIPPQQEHQAIPSEPVRSSEPYPQASAHEPTLTQQFSAPKQQAQTAHSIFEPDILELSNPITQSPVSQQKTTPDHYAPWTPPSRATAPKMAFDETIMTLTNPLDSAPSQDGKKPEKSTRFSFKPSSLGEFEDSLVSSQTISASASSLSRLAQASKTAPKRSTSFADQRNITLDQLVQDLIRPMIKQWIDTHLPSLVEEMVAKEIKRITKHLG